MVRAGAGVLSCIASWDSEDVFRRSFVANDNPDTNRASAIIASLRRVVEQGIKDGVLIPSRHPTDTRSASHSRQDMTNSETSIQE